jgi:UDP-N-acetylmuramyl-tripeptide synthetase
MQRPDSPLTPLESPFHAAQWLHSCVTGQLYIDSRKVRAGDGFVAWPGAAVDGRAFVTDALRQGAHACLVEAVGVEAFAFNASESNAGMGNGVGCYPGLKAAAGLIAAEYYGNPTLELDVVAITGTNGKTSIAWWLAHALSNSEQTIDIPCGLVGTLGIGKPNNGQFDLVTTGMTTPDPVLLQQTFREFVVSGLKACAIEASSIGLEEHRLAGTHIRCAVFTNFTQDHLDYHGSMEAYWQSKAALFQWPGLQKAVINIDDSYGAELAASLSNTDLDVWTVSCAQPARLQASNIVFQNGGLCFTVTEGAEAHHLATHLIGQYNVSNLLGVIGAMRSLGVPLAACIQACGNLQPVPGRMNCLGGSAQPLVAVDYAHTPDALSNALQALRPLASQRGGQLWCVFGCGGDRDPLKRPLMGAIAAQFADRVVLTSDNPRSETPQAIISQILLGLAGHGAIEVQSDRALAIAYALRGAAANDVVLVAGKGHEAYQEIAGLKHPFSDEQQVTLGLALYEVAA